MPSSFLMSDEQRQRAKEYLESAGIQVNHLPKLIWPDDAVSASQKHMYAPWKFTTKADILLARRQRMESNLWLKREYGVIKRVPLYVWVFYCTGIKGAFFEGWWLAIEGRGINICRHMDDELTLRIVELFPSELSLFGAVDIGDWKQMEEWKKEFVKKHRRGTWCGKPQGKAAVWAEVRGGHIERILSMAEWPRVADFERR